MPFKIQTKKPAGGKDLIDKPPLKRSSNEMDEPRNDTDNEDASRPDLNRISGDDAKPEQDSGTDYQQPARMPLAKKKKRTHPGLDQSAEEFKGHARKLEPTHSVTSPRSDEGADEEGDELGADGEYDLPESTRARGKTRKWRVIYGRIRPGKIHKHFEEDGTLVVQGTFGRLLNEYGDRVASRDFGPDLIRRFKPEYEFKMGDKEVQIDDEMEA